MKFLRHLTYKSLNIIWYFGFVSDWYINYLGARGLLFQEIFVIFVRKNSFPMVFEELHFSETNTKSERKKEGEEQSRNEKEVKDPVLYGFFLSFIYF